MTCERCLELETEARQLRMALRLLAECPPGTKEQRAKRQMAMKDARRTPQAIPAEKT